MLCLELTSLHVQPSQAIPRPLSADATQQMVVHALFGDAATASVITPEHSAGALEVVEIAALTDTSTADMMSWDVTDLGFRMGLSRDVPRILGRHVRPMTEQLLSRHGLALGDVVGWVVHPGGPEILETVGAELELTSDQLQPSRDVLRDYGNCSSATVPLILEHVRDRLTESGYLVALAFGPGLTLYAALLRAN
jgi:predicted naringenin-chalcone synthase